MSKYNFIVIDDSELDCYIAEKMIRYSGLSEDVKCFTGANEALQYVKDKDVAENDLQTVVILDVLMPIMSGFDYMDEFDKLPPEVKRKYQVIALTSSMNRNDIERIRSYDSVFDILDKPLSAESIAVLLSKL